MCKKTVFVILILFNFYLYSENKGLSDDWSVIDVPANNEKKIKSILGSEEFRAADYIGYEIKQTIDLFGVPDEIFSVRGDEDWQDDVVFYYKKNFYLFWYENRVWQVRLDKYSKDVFMGLCIGDHKAWVLEIFGKPVFEDEQSMVFEIPKKYISTEYNFPVYTRFFFEDSKVEDIYIYRGDF